MKKISPFVRAVACACLFLAGAVLLSGCETCKGIKRDVMNADQWIRDNLW
ncbi:MAG: hypothetical protein ACM3L6_03715 [Deltaproteobacteria bacterium]